MHFNRFFIKHQQLKKHIAPFFEPFSPILSKFCNALKSLVHRLFLVEMCFREEFIGKTYNLLFHGYRHEIAMWDRQIIL